jgi:GDPmannose 4,6-dehydratase
MYACNGILFNHESPIRGETFVTRKITRAAARIALNLQERLYLGNLNSKRDWGHAKDYVEAMYLILQQDKPEDFVIATGKTTEIREFVKMAFGHVGVILDFKGSGVNEIGFVSQIDAETFEKQTGKKCHLSIGQEVVFVDPKYFRPTEVDLLIGDPTKSNTKLGWKPKYDLPALVEDMMNSDIRLMQKQDYLKAGGFDTQNYFE